METQNKTEIKAKDKSLMAALGIIVAVVLILAIVGLLLIRPASTILQGQADASSVRVSGKLPGRVAEFYVEEGQAVKQGDTLVRIHSSLVDAKLMQAQAMETVASSMNQKVDAGTRIQIKNAAYDLWQQAIAAETITKKTYERLESLYKQGVVSEQKRDEAQAAYTAAQAAAKAAKSQYDLAVEGAQKEDKASAAAMVNAAKGSVDEVKAILEDQYLTAPCDGEISDIYPHVGELVAMGAPIMSVLKVQDMWITFNVREEMLNDMPMGKEIEVMIPALNKQKAKMKVFYIHDMGSYAVWSATKATGDYDSKTFQVKMRPETRIPNLRPGMSIIIGE
ncbi:MAG: efflux RND transporter periplasmic adaptor subunit [Muribaculaceae bacterium]|nr:efflux RND transporter periplasmic adaptor subunit [Muribaculaceae bacterium]